MKRILVSSFFPFTLWCSDLTFSGISKQMDASTVAFDTRPSMKSTYSLPVCYAQCISIDIGSAVLVSTYLVIKKVQGETRRCLFLVVGLWVVCQSVWTGLAIHYFEEPTGLTIFRFFVGRVCPRNYHIRSSHLPNAHC